MAILTANDFAAQMIAQLRVLDPSVSALVGTPERKIIDTVAQALADNQVDLTGLAGALDIDGKFGSNLDRFTALFGFARQSAVAATGYVVFSRNTPAPANITIPTGITIQSNVTTGTAGNVQLQYITTAGGTIAQGQTSSGAVPVTCTVTGSQGNAPTGALTQLVGTPVLVGVTAVTNAAPISGGTDIETDDVYKVRFKNTVFRNLAGTEDQFLALAVASSYTTKANVVGPVSKYREYIQVPDLDDAGNLAGVSYTNGATLPNGTVIPITNTGGTVGQWTTAQSAIPYAQDIYLNLPSFITNGQTGVTQYFFRQGVDFNFNYPSYIAGDAYRESESAATASPNWTFLNVYNPTSLAPAPATLQSATPGGILLVEYSYLSGASRNSIAHNVYNAIDIFVDGSNPVQTSCVFLPGAQTFTSSPTDPMYFENYRRDGEPAARPHPGNFFTPLLNSPITSVPATITVGTTNYYLGWHYWLVHDISQLHGSIRGRDGIEWSNFLGADAGNQLPPASSLTPLPGGVISLAPYSTPTGPTINNLALGTTIEVDNYNYDANIVVLQASLEEARQIATDVLAHSAKTRYFKLDVTVMYSPNAQVSVVNAAIGTALQAYMTRQYFGAVIRLADLLDVIYQVPGVINVRWSNDLPLAPTQMRVIECDINGNPLHIPYAERIVGGTASVTEIQRWYIPGGSYTSSNFGTSDGFSFTWTDPTVNGGLPVTNAPPGQTGYSLNALTASSLQTAIRNTWSGIVTSGIYFNMLVTQDPFVTNPLYPIATFLVTYGAHGTPYLPVMAAAPITQSPYAYDADFFLRDDELPSLPTGSVTGDTVPGVIIRPRAQNTFVRPGIG